MCIKECFIEKGLVVWKRRKAEFQGWLGNESYTWYQNLSPDRGGQGGPRARKAPAVRCTRGPPFFSSGCHCVRWQTVLAGTRTDVIKLVRALTSRPAALTLTPHTSRTLTEMFMGPKSQGQAEGVTFRVPEDWSAALPCAARTACLAGELGTKVDREAVSRPTPTPHRTPETTE